MELAASVSRTEGGDLFEPLLVDLLAMAEWLAVEVDHGTRGRNHRWWERLTMLSRAFLASFGDGSPEVTRLLEGLIDRRTGRRYSKSDQVAATAAPEFELSGAMVESLVTVDSEPVEPFRVARIAPSVLEVMSARSDDERWVRVLRRHGLVLLAQAPLRRGDGVDVAEVLVPPDVHHEDLDVQIIDVDQLSGLARRPADLVRAAVRAGRTAASAERLDDTWTASRRWDECAVLWSEAGDDERASLATRRAAGGGRFRGGSFVLDELYPFDEVDS